MMDYKFDELYSFIQREGREELRAYLERCGYFKAPASSQYHLCKDGGLLEHSVNVTNLMLQMKKAFELGHISIESIAITGLLHDIGKAGYYGKPGYIENILKNGQRSSAKPYESNKDMLSIPHEVTAIHTITQHISLTEEEVFAILYHNGLYTSTGYGLKGQERELQTLLHHCDLWSSRFIEK